MILLFPNPDLDCEIISDVRKRVWDGKDSRPEKLDNEDQSEGRKSE
jgi:hypothetical protein